MYAASGGAASSPSYVGFPRVVSEMSEGPADATYPAQSKCWIEFRAGAKARIIGLLNGEGAAASRRRTLDGRYCGWRGEWRTPLQNMYAEDSGAAASRPLWPGFGWIYRGRYGEAREYPCNQIGAQYRTGVKRRDAAAGRAQWKWRRTVRYASLRRARPMPRIAP